MADDGDDYGDDDFEDGSDGEEATSVLEKTTSPGAEEILDEEVEEQPGWPTMSLDDVELGEQLGGGGVSVVFKGLWGGRTVAVKTVQDTSEAASDALVLEYRNELLVMSQLRHTNIVQVLGACLVPPGLCIAMELCGPSLHKLLYRSGERFDHQRRLAVALDVGQALRYLHELDDVVVHRDIKSANVLVDTESGQCKLCDFGLSCSTVTSAGTPSYMAPELLAGRTFNASVDVYAFGVLVWELFAEQMPFDGYDISEVKRRVEGGERPTPPLSCPRVVQRLFCECWAQNSADRPNFTSIVPRLQEAQKSLAAAGYGGISSSGGGSAAASAGGESGGDYGTDDFKMPEMGDALDMLLK